MQAGEFAVLAVGAFSIRADDSTQEIKVSYTDPFGRFSTLSVMEGHLKLGARYYNPTTGRFTQPDPSGQETNTYNYASCNPANYTDPTGLDACLALSVQSFGLGVLATAASIVTVPVGATILGLPAAGVLGAFAITTGIGSAAAGAAAFSVCGEN